MASGLGRAVGVLVWIERALLLTPEAALLPALVCAHLIFGGSPLAGLLIVLLIVSFMIRAAALHLARAAIERGQRDEARALLQVALALYPWSADALALQGVLALMSGAPETAEERLRRAILFLPGQPGFHAALSGALLELGRPVEAAEAAQEALLLDRRCAVAYLHLAEAERTRGAPAQAVEDYLRDGLTVASAPAAEATLRCALAGHLLAHQRLAEATLTLHGAEALLSRCSVSSQAALHFCLGELLITQGQTERAQEYFQDAHALDPHGRYAAAAWQAGQRF